MKKQLLKSILIPALALTLVACGSTTAKMPAELPEEESKLDEEPKVPVPYGSLSFASIRVLAISMATPEVLAFSFAWPEMTSLFS